MTITCGLFLLNSHTKKFLICHPTHAPWNRWSIPKGLPEAAEDPLATALRELAEETGIDLRKESLRVHPLPETKYEKQNKALRSFLVFTESSFEGHPYRSNMVESGAHPENDKWKWIGLEEAEKWIHESQVRLVPEIRKLLSTI